LKEAMSRWRYSQSGFGTYFRGHFRGTVAVKYLSMKWTVKSGNILDENADVLICSANVFLNLSGGVGGAILLRCGDATRIARVPYAK
jgi:hypothetical protein